MDVVLLRDNMKTECCQVTSVVHVKYSLKLAAYTFIRLPINTRHQIPFN